MVSPEGHADASARQQQKGAASSAIGFAFLALLLPGAVHVYRGHLRGGIVWWLLIDGTLVTGMLSAVLFPSAAVALIWSRVLLYLVLRFVQVVPAVKLVSGEVRRPGVAVLFVLLTWGASAIATNVIRYALLEPWNMPTSSMEPALSNGDLFYSFKRGPGAHVERGAVIVYRVPDVPLPVPRQKYPWVRRVVGVAGDEVHVSADGELSVNGAVARTGPCQPSTRSVEGADVACFLESIGGRSSRTLFGQPYPAKDVRLVVPEGTVFVLADYRTEAYDSRHHGPVPIGNIIGRAGPVYLSFWPGTLFPRFDHIGRQP